MRRRGITLVELLLALAISILVTMAAGNAYVFGSRTSKNLSTGRETFARQAAFESSLTELFSHAYLDADATNLTTFFMSGDVLAGQSASSNSSSSGGEDALVFTVVGRKVPSPLLKSADDFETNNGKYGPVGGVSEIQLGTTPVGEGAAGREGLFLREQTPSDGDATQGGDESLLSEDIETIRFEFYDGTQWLTTWDTTTQATRRLPSAVRVTYKFRDETADRTLVLALPASDVTPENPVVEEMAS